MAKASTAQSPLNEYASALMAGLQTIPVDEIVECVRGNLKATRRIRMSKEKPEGEEEPDHATRQKAAEFIVNQTAGAAGTRKPIEAAPPTSEDKPTPGLLKGEGRKGKAGSQ